MHAEFLRTADAHRRSEDAFRGLSDARERWRRLQTQIHGLQADVDRSKAEAQRWLRLNPSTLLSRILGRLERHRQVRSRRLQEAESRLAQALRERAALDEEMTALSSTATELPRAESEMAAALERMQTWLRTNDRDATAALAELAEAENSLLDRLRHLDRARLAVVEALNLAGGVSDGLREAKAWSTIDLLDGSTFSSVAKQEALEPTTSDLSALHLALHRVQVLCRDVGISIELPDIPMVGGEASLDPFHDNPVTDLLSAFETRRSAKATRKTVPLVREAGERIEADRRRVQRELEGIRSSRLALLSG
jgi:hypothetical protein